MKRTANASWTGGLKAGKGVVSTASRALEQTQYSFTTRFENGVGTNPEELVAAAHASCFSMALSGQLEKSNLTGASRVETTATVTLDKLEEGWTVTRVHLDVSAEAPGLSREQFESAANEAKLNCPISRLLNAEISMSANLKEQAA